MRRGQTLIIVLWAMGLVSVAIGALSVRATHELRLGHIPLESLQRQAIAEAGVQQAIQVVTQDTKQSPQLDTLQETWATGSSADHTPLMTNLNVGEGTVSIERLEHDATLPGLVDEERKLHLNSASVDSLQRLIAAVGGMDVDAQRMAQTILDWRDEPIGPFCRDLSPPCHNGPFDSVDELRLVPGMSATLFAALEPYVTVYGSHAVNVNTAPSLILQALGCDGDALVRARNDQPFQNPPPSCPGTVVVSSAFTVPITATLHQSTTSYHMQAVIDRQGHILAWSIH